MSDTIQINEELARRRETLALARGSKTRGRPPLRQGEERTAEVRDASAAAAQGAPSSHAAGRAEATREGAPEEAIRRVRRDARDLGWTDIPAEYKKPGWDYEWKTITVLGQSVDDGALMVIREAGWRPERARDWPTMVPEDTSPDKAIERNGQRLYGRPMRLTQEARREDAEAANRQRAEKAQAASTGQSANRNEAGIPNSRGVRAVPLGIEIYEEAGI